MGFPQGYYSSHCNCTHSAVLLWKKHFHLQSSTNFYPNACMLEDKNAIYRHFVSKMTCWKFQKHDITFFLPEIPPWLNTLLWLHSIHLLRVNSHQCKDMRSHNLFTIYLLWMTKYVGLWSRDGRCGNVGIFIPSSKGHHWSGFQLHNKRADGLLTPGKSLRG